MNETFGDACVDLWELLAAGLALSDDNDRHVVAAAIRGCAGAAVMNNVCDFPTGVLDEFGLHAVAPKSTSVRLLGPQSNPYPIGSSAHRAANKQAMRAASV